MRRSRSSSSPSGSGLNSFGASHSFISCTMGFGTAGGGLSGLRRASGSCHFSTCAWRKRRRSAHLGISAFSFGMSLFSSLQRIFSAASDFIGSGCPARASSSPIMLRSSSRTHRASVLFQSTSCMASPGFSIKCSTSSRMATAHVTSVAQLCLADVMSSTSEPCNTRNSRSALTHCVPSTSPVNLERRLKVASRLQCLALNPSCRNASYCVVLLPIRLCCGGRSSSILLPLLSALSSRFTPAYISIACISSSRRPIAAFVAPSTDSRWSSHCGNFRSSIPRCSAAFFSALFFGMVAQTCNNSDC
mmetsp:Transcript_67358/g.98552  ORF Transcript_67358/g.98552 Transcript_67358/m.98552 type:complete len:304 (-) Transcript_67358:89-1000(-)